MIHLLLRPHFYLSSPADLKQVGSKVWLGPSGSGSRLTAQRLLQASGIVESDIDKLFSAEQIKDWRTASNRLLDPINHDGLYAFFWTRAVRTLDRIKGSSTDNADNLPDPVDIVLAQDAHIAAVPQEVITRITDDDLYVATAIPLNAYGKKLKHGVPTVGIATALIAAKSSQQEEVSDLIKVINDNKSTIATHTGMELDLFGEKVSPGGRLAGLVHPGARTHLVDNKSVWVWPAIAVLVAFLLLLILRPPQILRSNSPALSYALLLCVILGALCVGLALKMTSLEGRINPSFATNSTSIRTMVSFVLGASREGKLMTHQGENLIMWALFVIPLVFGWLTSDIIREGLRRLSQWLPSLFRRIGSRLAFRRIAWLVAVLKRLGRKHATNA